MKTIINLFICLFFVLYSCSSFSEEDSYIDFDEETKVLETSKGEKRPEREKNQYQYDVEIYPYISVKYTSTKIIEKDF